MTKLVPLLSLSANQGSGFPNTKFLAVWKIVWILIPYAILLIFHSGQVLAKEPSVPHKNPAQTTEEISITSTLGFFSSVSELIVEGEYQKTTQLLTDLDIIDLPPNVKFLVERYSGLLNELNAGFDQAESEISKAQFFLQQNELGSAELSLQVAEKRMSALSGGLSEIKRTSKLLIASASVSNIVQLTGFDGISEQKKTIAKASARLEESVASLEELNLQFLSMVASLHTFTSPSIPLPKEFQVTNVPVYEVELSIDSPSVGQPGRPIIIRGQVVARNKQNIENVRLKFFLGDYYVAEYTGSSNFEYTLTVPGTALVGNTLIFVEFPAQGLFQKTSSQNDIQVRRVSPMVTTEISQLGWFPPTVRIAGNIQSEIGEIPEPKVVLRYQEKEVSIIADRRGNFSTRIQTSYLSLLFGRDPLVVTVSPSQPWFENLETSITINSLGVNRVWIIALILIYLFGLLGFKRIRHNKFMKIDRELSKLASDSVDNKLTTPENIATLSTKFTLSSSQTQIVSLYQNAAQILGSQKGIFLLPSTTLRDFLSSIGSQVESAFEELTQLTERALYGLNDPPEEQVRLADQLLENIKGNADNVS